jgi:ABC-type Na+ efflux pump permease subunit
MDKPSVSIDNAFSQEYPAPPNVHWTVLLAVWVAIVILTELFVPKPLWRLVTVLAFCPWPLYLCLWMRKLDPKSKSLFWVLASVVGEVALAEFPVRHNPNTFMIALVIVSVIILFALPVVAIFVIRAELQKHYNESEAFGLKLDPITTFAFSYFYFQYHLYDIAQSKKRQAEEILEKH